MKIKTKDELNVTSPTNKGLYYQGRESCQSCRYVDYNGEKCMQQLSPNYYKVIGVADWCRFWSPDVGHNIPLKK